MYALTVNPNIYVSYIKQFWNTVVIKQDNDITRLQALVDKKKVVVTEVAIREVLRLDDAEGVDCLPNEEIFAEMARSMSAKRTSWNKFSSAIASAVICLSTGDDAPEPSIPSPTPPTPPPQPPQDLPSTSQVQHTPPQSPQPQPQPQPQAQQQAGDFPLSLLQEALDACAALFRRVEHLEYDKVAQALEITKLKSRVKNLEKEKKERKIDELDKDDDVALMEDKKEEEAKEDELAEVQVVVDVVTTAKLITKVVTAASKIISAAEPQVSTATITAAPVRVGATSTRRRKGVVTRDPKEESTTSSIIPADTKSNDKGKRIMIEEPKPLKKKQQVEMDEEYARKLHAEINKDIDWDVAIDHVKQKAKEDPTVQRYQAIKRKPLTEAQAQRNMIMYLKNVASFRLDYFKGMSYDDIHPIFEVKFNSNVDFLLKTKEQMEEEESKAIQSINETPAQKAAKRRKLNKEVEDLKRHLEIMPDEDDDVYTEATPLARKNFDREDLESLWNLVKERFSTSKPKNFSDDFLLTTLEAMFEKPNGQAQVWKNQRTIHGQAKVKIWKLLESCGSSMAQGSSQWSVKHVGLCWSPVEQHGPANVNVVSSAVDKPSTTAPINSGNKNGTKDAHGIPSPTNEENLNNFGTMVRPTSVGNTPGMSSYANVTGEPSRKALNFCNLFKLGGNRIDVVVLVESISERCACCKVFDHIQEECPKNSGLGVVKNLKKPSQAPRGVSVGSKVGFKLVKQAYKPVSTKPTANTSGSKKNDVDPAKKVSNSNPFDVLKSVESDVDLGINGMGGFKFG
nr:zinc knuckle CX2CX4HX4C [Tanacetum cinerariifolium]